MATDGDLQDSDAKGGGAGSQRNPESSRESSRESVAGRRSQANADRDADAALLALARSGDREAWARLCHKHAPRLAAYLGARLRRPAVVEKLIADAIVTAWATLPELDAAEEFAPWLRRIGGNLALRWRSENHHEKLSEPFPDDRCAGDAAALARMRRLEEALGRLHVAERMAIEQRYRAGLDGAPLDEVLHVQDGAADEVVQRAIDALAREFEK